MNHSAICAKDDPLENWSVRSFDPNHLNKQNFEPSNKIGGKLIDFSRPHSISGEETASGEGSMDISLLHYNTLFTIKPGSVCTSSERGIG